MESPRWGVERIRATSIDASNRSDSSPLLSSLRSQRGPTEELSAAGQKWEKESKAREPRWKATALPRPLVKETTRVDLQLTK